MTRALLFVMLTAGAAGAQLEPPAPPPVPALPGAGRPVDLEATRARRERLVARIGDGVVVVPAASPRDLEREVLQDNAFRQDDYFFYLTGLETPDAWLVLVASTGAVARTYLFLPPRDPGSERWTGLKLGPGDDAARLSGIARTVLADSLDAIMRGLGAAAGPVYVSRGGIADRVAGWGIGGGDVRNVVPILDSLRVVKDAAELARLRRAVAITVEGQKAAMRALRPGMWEYQLEATVEYTFRDLGADRVGFPSIVGSGPNGTTLHYDVNRRQMWDGELVVVDVGAEYGQYTADITRTLPVSGRFTPRQRALYDLVLATQQAALDSVRPGRTLAELNRIARAYMREHGADLCGARNCADYFVHGLSHGLGMRVHDVGDYAMPLVPGAVITIEPGVYISEENLGVRIEDDVLVTATGGELLSAGAPRTAADIEAYMRARTRAP